MEINGCSDVDGIEGAQRRLGQRSCSSEKRSVQRSQCQYLDQGTHTLEQ